MTREDVTDSKEVVSKHYQHLGASYDQFLYYSDDFVRRLTSKMIEALRLEADDVFVDLGGGTGMYSADILRQVPLSHPVVLVEPFAEMLANVPPDLSMRPVQQDALSFSSEPGSYDKILMKEAVHHVDDQPRLFGNLLARLNPAGRLLLVHVPPKLDYPLFQAALRRCETWHADPLRLVDMLRDAGFTVTADKLEYRHVIPKESYFRMVEGRYMSVLSSFSDAELRAGLAEMAETHADRTTLEFVDRFDYLTAVKP